MNPNLPRNIEFHIPKVKDAQAAYDVHMQLEPPRPVPTDPRGPDADRFRNLAAIERRNVRIAEEFEARATSER